MKMNLFVWSSSILNSVVLFEFNVSMKCTIIISKWWIQCIFFFLCNKAPDVLLYTIGRRELCMHQKVLGLVNNIFWSYIKFEFTPIRNNYWKLNHFTLRKGNSVDKPWFSAIYNEKTAITHKDMVEYWKQITIEIITYLIGVLCKHQVGLEFYIDMRYDFLAYSKVTSIYSVYYCFIS